jgi:hypothetical protein
MYEWHLAPPWVVDRRGYVKGFGSHALQLPGEETPDERRYLVKRGLK